jgi:glycerate kinase
MRILIAPDKFKGTLSAKDAAAAIAMGVRRAAEEHGIEVEIEECPVADGGEGTLEAIEHALPGRRHRSTVHDWDGAPARAHWLSHDAARPFRDRFAALISLMGAVGPVMFGVAILIASTAWSASYGWGWFAAAAALGVSSILVIWLFERLSRRPESVSRERTACLEVAQVIGVRAIHPRFRNPELIDTEIVGDLIDRALEDGCGRFLIGLGGTLSVDGGIGVGRLTHSFLNARGLQPPGHGETLPDIARIEPHIQPNSRIREAEFIALCDVSNPLLGPSGAARVFGPQKGATPEQVERLEAGLENLVKVCRECGIPCDPDQPGAGAAGGLGFGLATFLGATLTPGAPFILDLIGFNERAERADLIIAGEGRLDSQTASGKAVAEVARRAAELGKPCIAVVGSTEGSTDQIRAALAAEGVHFDAVASAADAAGSTRASLQEPAKWVQAAGRRAVNEYLSHPRA